MHAVVDAYGNPVHLMISEGQRNDIVYAIPLLEQVKIPEDSQILADRGYDSDQLIDYIYSRGAEPTVRRKTL
nr:transposase [Mediterraneibacter gnavus]